MVGSLCAHNNYLLYSPLLDWSFQLREVFPKFTHLRRYFILFKMLSLEISLLYFPYRIFDSSSAVSQACSQFPVESLYSYLTPPK